MPRRARVQYENAFYHVMNRGRGRHWIFHGDEYYETFLLTLEEAHERFEAKIHAYCLMGNHYHLLVETPHANLDRVMRHINGVYTQRYNRRKSTDGPLFRGRYKSILVDESSYLLQVGRYIHLNPREVKGAKPDVLESYRWSSYLAYIGRESPPSWLCREKMYRTLGAKDPCVGYRQFVLEGLDERTREFYGSEYLLGIFGDKAYRESIYEEREQLAVVTDVEALIMPPIELDEIVDAVAEIFRVDVDVIVKKQKGRRIENSTRRFAIYCAKRLGRYSQRAVAEYFGLNHPGSVSSTVRSIEKQVGCGMLDNELEEVRKRLKIVKLT